MKGTQRAGLLRLFATVALFLGLVSMHQLALAQCDDVQHSTSASSLAKPSEHVGMTMPGASNAAPAPIHSHAALGCACMLAMCLAILVVLLLLPPASMRGSLRVRERKPLPDFQLLHFGPIRPPDLLALSVSRT